MPRIRTQRVLYKKRGTPLVVNGKKILFLKLISLLLRRS